MGLEAKLASYRGGAASWSWETSEPELGDPESEWGIWEPREPAVLTFLECPTKDIRSIAAQNACSTECDNKASSCLKCVIGQFVVGFGEDECLGQAREEAQRVHLPHFSLAVAQESVAVQKNRLGARKSTLVLSHSRNPAKT